MRKGSVLWSINYAQDVLIFGGAPYDGETHSTSVNAAYCELINNAGDMWIRSTIWIPVMNTTALPVYPPGLKLNA